MISKRGCNSTSRRGYDGHDPLRGNPPIVTGTPMTTGPETFNEVAGSVQDAAPPASEVSGASRAATIGPGTDAATTSRLQPQPHGLRRAGQAARLLLAVAAGKTAASASRAAGRGGGTSLPGIVARRFDPHVLTHLVGDRGLTAVAVTGTNGKTTISRFTAALLRGEGLRVAHNSAGSNLLQGVTSLAIQSVDLRGRMSPAVFVAEVDEGALLRVAPEIKPRVLLVSNLFRDQLDRFGEIYAVADAIDRVATALPPDATLIVNADDPMVAEIGASRVGRRMTFGLEVAADFDRITSAADTIRCPRCRVDLHYDHVYLSHLGDFRCENCGFTRPPRDVAMTRVEVRGLSETAVTVRTPRGEFTLTIPHAGIHIAYNAAAALTVCAALGVDTPRAAASLASVPAAFGRLERITADEREIVLAFAKNPTSFNATLRTLQLAGEPRHLLLAVSNTLVDGEDFGWLWDVEFEAVVPAAECITVSGLRADELATRIKYAGADQSRVRVVPDRAAALDAALAAVPPGGRLTALAGYTPTIELRQEMRRRGWVGHYWAA